MQLQLLLSFLMFFSLLCLKHRHSIDENDLKSMKKVGILIKVFKWKSLLYRSEESQTCYTFSTLFIKLNIDGRITKYDNNQWQCIHQNHTKQRVKYFVHFITKEIVRHTLLVASYIWMGFQMKNYRLRTTTNTRKKPCNA